jgi:type I restriction enzyme S subunit
MEMKPPAHIRKLMKELKEGFTRIYGNRLKDVYLYGSYARGDYRPGSDVDVMILLSQYENYWDELRRSTEFASDMSLKYDLTVSRLIVQEGEWSQSGTPLLRNIHREGMPA